MSTNPCVITVVQPTVGTVEADCGAATVYVNDDEVTVQAGEVGAQGTPGTGGAWGTFVGDILTQLDLQAQFDTKLDSTDAQYSGISEAEVTHAFSGGGTATINYLSANSGGNCHLISEDTGGTVVITLGADLPAAHDALTLKIDLTNLTGLTWTDQASFVNVGAGLDYEACAAFDAGTTQLIIRIEKIGGELFYFESSIL